MLLIWAMAASVSAGVGTALGGMIDLLINNPETNKKEINKQGSVAEETQDQRTGQDKLIFFVFVLEMWYEDSAIPKHEAIIETVRCGIAALG